MEGAESKIIVKAFKKCTIPNALDGSEDDCVWQEKENVTAKIPSVKMMITTFTTMMKTTHHYLFCMICIIFSKRMTPMKNLMGFKRH